MSWEDAIVTVLRGSEQPMSRFDIIDEIQKRGLREITSRNPYNAMNSHMQKLLDGGIVKLAGKRGLYELA